MTSQLPSGDQAGVEWKSEVSASLRSGMDAGGRVCLAPKATSELDPTDGVPFWSFDSRYIVFWTGGKLKKIDASSGPPQTLCDAPVPVFRGFWTRDNRIVFASATGVLQVAAGGGVPSPFTTLDRARQEIYHGVPALLPDGRHFAYLRYAPGSVENGGIYLASLDTKPEAQGLKPWATYHKRQQFDECGTPC